MYFSGELLTGMQEILGDCRLLAHVLTGKKHEERAGFSAQGELLTKSEPDRFIRQTTTRALRMNAPSVTREQTPIHDSHQAFKRALFSAFCGSL
jgi:hypothetical protein